MVTKKYYITTYSEEKEYVGRLHAEYDTLREAMQDIGRYFWKQQLAFIHNMKEGCIAKVYNYETHTFSKPADAQQRQFLYKDGNIFVVNH